MSVPVATANVEIILSQININKNKTRNRLQVPTLCSILRTKEMAFKFTKEMFKSN